MHPRKGHKNRKSIKIYFYLFETYQSVPTAINKKRRIEGIEDLNELIDELSDKNLYSEILINHNDIRTPDSNLIITSNLKILAILTVYMFILLEDYE